MININLKYIEGQKYFSTGADSATEYTCVGFGQSPSDGANYIVGASWDQASNRTLICTHLFKNVRFLGKLPALAVP